RSSSRCSASAWWSAVLSLFHTCAAAWIFSINSSLALRRDAQQVNARAIRALAIHARERDRSEVFRGVADAQAARSRWPFRLRGFAAAGQRRAVRGVGKFEMRGIDRTELIQMQALWRSVGSIGNQHPVASPSVAVGAVDERQAHEVERLQLQARVAVARAREPGTGVRG